MILTHPTRVDFNPALVEHRKAFNQFLKRRAWADSPLLFTHDPGYGNVVEQISEKLVTWYMEKDRVLHKEPRIAKKAVS